MTESAKEEISRRLIAYPKEALPYLKHGFAAAAKLSDQAKRSVLDEMIANFQRGTRRLDSDTLSEITELPRRVAEQTGAVYSLVIGLLTDVAASPDEFVEAGAGLIFFEEDRAAALAMAKAVCDARSEISRTVARTQLAGEVLPSLFTFDVAVDLRVRIENGKVVTSVPVAVLHIDTDADDHEIWLQLSKGDIDAIIKSLTKCLQDMQVAETLAPTES